MVRSGRVEIRIGDLVYETVGAGGIVGEMALLDDDLRVRSATAIAATDSEIVEVGQEMLLEFIGRFPELGLKLCQIVVRRLRATTFLTHHDAVTLLPNGKTRMYVGEGAQGSPYARLARIVVIGAWREDSGLAGDQNDKSAPDSGAVYTFRLAAVGYADSTFTVEPAAGHGVAIAVDLRPVFDWEDVPGATGYLLQVSTVNTFATLALNAASAASSYTPTANLPAGVKLYWRVREGMHGLVGRMRPPGRPSRPMSTHWRASGSSSRCPVGCPGRR